MTPLERARHGFAITIMSLLLFAAVLVPVAVAGGVAAFALLYPAGLMSLVPWSLVVSVPVAAWLTLGLARELNA